MAQSHDGESAASAGLTRNGWYALPALAFSTLFALTVAAGVWMLHSYRTPVDFASFWAAGRLALMGQPALAYDAEAHRAIEMIVVDIGGALPFPYPPPFLFAVTPFAFHPIWLAYLGWMLLSAGLYFAATRPALPPRFAFAHPAAMVNAAIGQNGFVITSILLFGISALAARPFAAGAIFGLLVIKPQLAVLIPVALVAAQEWRAIGGAAFSSLLILAMAALVFGPETYLAFIAVTREYVGYVAADRWSLVEHASVFAFFRFLGVPHAVALAAQGVSAIIAAILTWRAWSLGAEQRGAILAAATLLVPPYVFTYDSLLLILPIAWLLRDSTRPWRPAIVWLCLFVPLFGYVGLYPGPNTIPIGAALCLWWLRPSRSVEGLSTIREAAPATG